jgi:hypothetical protein
VSFRGIYLFARVKNVVAEMISKQQHLGSAGAFPVLEMTVAKMIFLRQFT